MTSMLNQSQLRTAPKPSCTPVQTGILQRRCACGNHTVASGECAECRKKRLQRKATSQSEMQTVPPIVHEVLRSPGRTLDPTTRAFMESRFGHDFSYVQVHTDTRAAESAQALNALAYTVGQDVVFGGGKYQPDTNEGRKLLAHELTHVIQQSGKDYNSTGPPHNSQLQGSSEIAASSLSPLTTGTPANQAEREANQIANGVMSVEREGTAQVFFAESSGDSRILRRQPASPTATPQQLRELQLHQLATRPRLALQQWQKLAQGERDQILWTMMSLYDPSFSSEFLRYAEKKKKPRLNEGGVLKGFEHTSKWLFDRGYRHAYGELWVHPSGEEVIFLGLQEKNPTPGPIEKECPENCFSESQDEAECRNCCEETFPEVGSKCRKYCDSRCNEKL